MCHADDTQGCDKGCASSGRTCCPSSRCTSSCRRAAATSSALHPLLQYSVAASTPALQHHTQHIGLHCIALQMLHHRPGVSKTSTSQP